MCSMLSFFKEEGIHIYICLYFQKEMIEVNQSLTKMEDRVFLNES